jgi:hypothetical protein
MGMVFAIVCFVAGVWSAVTYQVTYHAVLDALPPQFQSPLTSRYAFPVYALSPSTPLPLQADYIKALAGMTFALLCFSLSCFLFGRLDGGLLAFFGFGAGVVSTFKSWKTYKANCDQPSVQHGATDI